MGILYKIILAIYIFINGIFIYKYGQRQNIINSSLLLAIYVFLIVGLVYAFQKDVFKLSKTNSITKYLYWAIVVICSMIFSFLIFKTNGENLNVDRWSALELTVEGILYGNYPYTQVNHVGNMSSNFPALGLLALPFYLLGDVGFLQVFIFILFSLHLYKERKSISNAYFILFLFLLSPALLWEIAVKSDLVSNLMLLVLFIEWWDKRFSKDMFKKPVLLGVIIAFFLLTRGVVVIPLIIFFFKGFLDCSFNTKIRFISSLIIVSLLICLPVFLSAPDWDTFINYNPLRLQTNKTPILSYLFLLFTFFITYAVKKTNNYYFYSAIIIFIIPLNSMINFIIEEGWYKTIFEHKFDISYLSMSIPFILIWIKNYRDGTDKIYVK